MYVYRLEVKLKIYSNGKLREISSRGKLSKENVRFRSRVLNRGARTEKLRIKSTSTYRYASLSRPLDRFTSFSREFSVLSGFVTRCRTTMIRFRRPVINYSTGNSGRVNISWNPQEGWFRIFQRVSPGFTLTIHTLRVDVSLSSYPLAYRSG